MLIGLVKVGREGGRGLEDDVRYAEKSNGGVRKNLEDVDRVASGLDRDELVDVGETGAEIKAWSSSASLQA